MATNKRDAISMTEAFQWILRREGITTRAWKAKKRKELKAIMDAFNVYLGGCAHCPGYGNGSEIQALEEQLRKMIDTHSVKKWGR